MQLTTHNWLLLIKNYFASCLFHMLRWLLELLLPQTNASKNYFNDDLWVFLPTTETGHQLLITSRALFVSFALFLFAVCKKFIRICNWKTDRQYGFWLPFGNVNFFYWRTLEKYPTEYSIMLQNDTIFSIFVVENYMALCHFALLQNGIFLL